jgi:hypothetical protein
VHDVGCRVEVEVDLRRSAPDESGSGRREFRR